MTFAGSALSLTSDSESGIRLSLPIRRLQLSRRLLDLMQVRKIRRRLAIDRDRAACAHWKNASSPWNSRPSLYDFDRAFQPLSETSTFQS